MILALFLGIAVAILGVTAVVLVKTADDARDEAAAATGGMEQSSSGGVGLPLQSFAGQRAADADELAAARPATEAALPPVPAGDVVKVNLTVKDQVVEIAPGVQYRIWSFAGTGVPGPTIHVRQGQTVQVKITNGGSIPHSIDFHAARIPPNEAFRDAAPGESVSYSFTAADPGVFMYHCGTKPVLAHIANGMYGAIVIDPAKPLPKVDRAYVLVGSEFYLDSPGIDEPANLEMTKSRLVMPDWATFNGYANQYVSHPLTAAPGERVRFYVVAAGPSVDVRFHIVGTIFDRAWPNQDLSRYQTGVQTVSVPAGGGGIFDVKIDQPGLYPIVNHAFAYADLGQVGLLKVGNPKGATSH
jgi:nitrite reductase (NO-forming)